MARLLANCAAHGLVHAAERLDAVRCGASAEGDDLCPARLERAADGILALGNVVVMQYQVRHLHRLLGLRGLDKLAECQVVPDAVGRNAPYSNHFRLAFYAVRDGAKEFTTGHSIGKASTVQMRDGFHEKERSGTSSFCDNFTVKAPRNFRKSLSGKWCSHPHQGQCDSQPVNRRISLKSSNFRIDNQIFRAMLSHSVGAKAYKRTRKHAFGASRNDKSR